jgi:hypothetical protein
MHYIITQDETHKIPSAQIDKVFSLIKRLKDLDVEFEHYLED